MFCIPNFKHTKQAALNWLLKQSKYKCIQGYFKISNWLAVKCLILWFFTYISNYKQVNVDMYIF